MMSYNGYKKKSTQLLKCFGMEKKIVSCPRLPLGMVLWDVPEGVHSVLIKQADEQTRVMERAYS